MESISKLVNASNIKIVIQELIYFIDDGYLDHYPEQKQAVIDAVNEIKKELEKN
jgi:hypothetical protein